VTCSSVLDLVAFGVEALDDIHCNQLVPALPLLHLTRLGLLYTNDLVTVE
jgi:hypothetical protein